MFVFKDDPYLLQFNNLASCAGLVHFTTTIKGGMSQGAYSSFNLGLYSGDQPESVYENRQLLAGSLDVPVSNLYFPYQTHEDTICILDEDFLKQSPLQQQQALSRIDAMITDQKNVCIGITTADCVPVIVFDPQRKVLGVIHAGWRGLVNGIIKKTITNMVEKYGSVPKMLLAGIGPSISQEKFEVGDEVVNAFIEAGFSRPQIGKKNPISNKYHLDLWLAAYTVLSDAGLFPENIETAGMCTYSNPDLFFSARRQGVHSGRMVTGGLLS